MVNRGARLYLYDGIKTVPAWNVDSNEGWTILSGEGETVTADVYFQRVPWLYRGVLDRANNVAAMPFAIVRGETDFDTSATWANRLKLFSNPGSMLRRLEMSLTMTGRAYLFLETNTSGYIQAVKYCTPYSISEVYDPQTGELTGYKRRIGTRSTVFDVPLENIVPIYDPDYTTEIGPGKSSAALAAMTASGVLFNADRFISDYFRRGAIKATILAVDGGGRDEAERLQSWWSDVIGGIKNAWAAFVVKAQQIKPTIIGEGLESLQNNELTTERRQDVATALGIPESRLWSSAANYATSHEDTKTYYRSTIIPECEAIAAALNEHLFTAAHHLDMYRIEFRPETLDMFQADAAEQSTAAKSFIDFLVACPTADICKETAVMMGFELSEAILQAIDAWFTDKDARAAEVAQQMQSSQTSQTEPAQTPMMDAEPDVDGEDGPNPQETRAALATWRRKAIRALKKGESADVEFTTTLIPARVQASLHYELAACKSEEDIKAAFETVKEPDPDALLREAIDLLKRFENVPA